MSGVDQKLSKPGPRGPCIQEATFHPSTIWRYTLLFSWRNYFSPLAQSGGITVYTALLLEKLLFTLAQSGGITVCTALLLEKLLFTLAQSGGITVYTALLLETEACGTLTRTCIYLSVPWGPNSALHGMGSPVVLL